MREFRSPRPALGHGRAQAFRPIIGLRHRAADDSAGPNELERRELPPGLIAVDDGAGDEVAGHRRGVEAVAAEAARQPHAGTELADLRHAVDRVAERAGPCVICANLAELWISLFDIGGERAGVAARIAFPRRRPARPHQPVAADDTVVIVGEVGIADRTAIIDRFRKPRPQRRGGDHIGGDRNERGGDRRHQRGDLDIAAQHHMVGAQPRVWRDDALAHAGRIDGQSRGVLEDVGTGALGSRRQAQRIIERVDIDRAGKMDGVKVALAAQRCAHLLGRPALDLDAEFAEEPGETREHIAVVDLGDVKPAVLRIDPGNGAVGDGVADVVEPALRQRPQILGARKSDAADDALGRRGKTRKHESGIAARGVFRKASGFDEHDGPPAARHLARRRQAREPAADDADIDIEIGRERRPLRRIHFGRGVPASAIG